MTQTVDEQSKLLFDFITKAFNEEELKTLCFDCGVEYEDLPSNTRSGKARELILYCQRHEWVSNLLLKLKEQRPEQFPKSGLTAPTDKPILNPFPANLTTDVAYPIAVACHAFNQATDKTTISQFISLDRLIENLVKYLVAIAFTHAWRTQPDKAQLRLWLSKLSRSRLEEWLAVWEAVGDQYAADPRPSRLIFHLYDNYRAPIAADSPIAAAYKFLTKQLAGQQVADHESALTLAGFWRQLLRYRHLNWEGHAGQVDEYIRAALLPLLQPALQEILLSLPIITQYKLQYLQRADRLGHEWIYTRYHFQGHGAAPTLLKPLHIPAVGAEPEQRPRRLYLCDGTDTPFLNLHPLLIAYNLPNQAAQLYFFDYNADEGEITFLDCGSSKSLKSPLYIKTLAGSLFDPAAEEDDSEAQDPIHFLGETESKIEEDVVARESLDDLPLATLLNFLSDEGREALEIGLGEALRIGRFWLGGEFLLMGLSKQRGRPFPLLLRELGLHPGDFRGILRGTIKIEAERWREQDPVSLGKKALPHIQLATPDLLAQAKAKADGYPPVITPRLKTILHHAYQLANKEPIGHRHLLIAALAHHQAIAVQLLFTIGHEAEWSPTQLLERAEELVHTEPAELPPPTAQDDKRPFPPPQAARKRPHTPESILEKIGHNLTQAAAEGKVGEAYGENARRALTEIGRTLLKKEGNNPILLGESGVGKTAVIEGLAWRLAGRGKGVIPQLQDKQIIQLSAADLTAGTKYRGDLEERLQQLVEEVKEAAGQVIIFIDEIHTLLSSDSSRGLSTIAEKLKPALARGEFPCIGATTVAEYRRYIEKDPALARRFSPVWLEEPTIDDAIEIVTHVAGTRLADHHGGVAFSPKAIETAVQLTARHIHDERLPGKAIKVLDEAASSLIMGGSLSGDPTEIMTATGGRVTSAVVTSIVAAHTNIPAEQLAKSNRQRLRELEGKLKARIKGQDEAIERVVRVLKRAGTGFGNEKRPLGVFLFTGPTGVGKTELARAIAAALFDNEETIIRLDMSEFMEKHQVSRLIGAPPGYIRSDEEGQLTGQLRRRPYSVVLLDEMEKAHEDVQHLFLQLFDNGRLTDSHGNIADGRQAIFIMTTNLGARGVMGTLQGDGYREVLKTAVYNHFSPEFMNRLDRIVYFQPLDEAALLAIFDKEFQPFQARFEQQGIRVAVPDDIKRQIVEQVAQQQIGARPLQRYIEDQIVTPLIDKLLDEDFPTSTVHIGRDIELRSPSLSPWAEQPAAPNLQFDPGKFPLPLDTDPPLPLIDPLAPEPDDPPETEDIP